MYEEIDLKPYIRAVLDKWYWIAAAALLAAIAAFGISSMLPDTYEATSLVAVTDARQIVQFDPRFETVQFEQPLEAYPALATSDELLQLVLQEVAPQLPEIESVQQLRGMVEAGPASDPTLVQLTVRYGNAGTAAMVANTWAALFAEWATAIYSNSNDEQLAFFEAQLADSKSELEEAENRLIEFESRNRAAILETRLLSLQETQANYLTEQRDLIVLLRDLRSLGAQMAENGGSEEISFGDQLTALALQLRAYNAEEALPLQFQLETAQSFASRSYSEQIALLDELIAIAEARASETDERLAELEPEILSLQQQKAEMDVELARLNRERDLADETYLAVARKVEEESITSQDQNGTVRLASQAVVPDRPASRSRLLVTALAAVVSAVMVAAALLARVWWQLNIATVIEPGERTVPRPVE